MADQSIEATRREVIDTTAYRILAKTNWTTGEWTEQPAPSGRDPGIELKILERVCLPAVGRARFEFVAGDYATLPESAAATTAPDLEGQEIRIQFAVPVEEGESEKWRTVWWGTCEYQEDKINAANADGDNSEIVRTYHCVDGLGRFRRRRLDRHQWYHYGVSGAAEGHPGFNGDGRTHLVLGNRSPFGDEISLGYDAHTHYGTGDAWTDRQVIENVLAVAARDDDPKFSISDQTAPEDGDSSVLDAVGVYPVADNANAFDILAQIADRKRGKGLIFLDFDDDTGESTGPLRPKIVVRPQHKDDVTYTRPSDSSSVTLKGADTVGTTVTVTIQGDHRYAGDSFSLGTRSKISDYVEVVGERIQVVVTLSHGDDTLVEGWDEDDETAFDFETTDSAKSSKYYHVYRSHILPPDWDYVVRDGTGGAQSRCDYRCDDDGSVTQPGAFDDPDTSPILARPLATVPIFPGRDANDDDARESIQRSRALPLAWVVEDGDLVDLGLRFSGLSSPKIDGRYITIDVPGNLAQGVRQFHGGAAVAYDDLAVTIAVEIPRRVRVAYSASSGTTDGADADLSRRKYIYLPDHHLWLGHNQATYTGQDFSNNPTILRDDRDKIHAIAALAFEWYGKQHLAGRFTMRLNGFLNEAGEDFGDENTIDVAGGWGGGPMLGDVITSLVANGQTYSPNTPITAMRYVRDREVEETEYVFDWQDLDFRRTAL